MSLRMESWRDTKIHQNEKLCNSRHIKTPLNYYRLNHMYNTPPIRRRTVEAAEANMLHPSHCKSALKCENVSSMTCFLFFLY